MSRDLSANLESALEWDDAEEQFFSARERNLELLGLMMLYNEQLKVIEERTDALIEAKEGLVMLVKLISERE